jgi:hypothetical protein
VNCLKWNVHEIETCPYLNNNLVPWILSENQSSIASNDTMETNKENHNLKENSHLDNLLFSTDIILFLIVCPALVLWRNKRVMTG